MSVSIGTSSRGGLAVVRPGCDVGIVRLNPRGDAAVEGMALLAWLCPASEFAAAAA
ncbi:MAG: hypothetical protein ACKVK6_17875 [bacterium]